MISLRASTVKWTLKLRKSALLMTSRARSVEAVKVIPWSRYPDGRTSSAWIRRLVKVAPVKGSKWEDRRDRKREMNVKGSESMETYG